MQLKREAKLLTVIGLSTKHADCFFLGPQKIREETTGMASDWSKLLFTFISV